VVDNFYELSLLEQVCIENKSTVKILLRVTPGVEAHTHDYITTGQEDSKFGFGLENGQADQAVEQALHSQFVNLLGIHSHIEYLLFDTTGFLVAAQKMFGKLKVWKERLGYAPEVLSLGGVFGTRYTEEDIPRPSSTLVRAIIGGVK